MEKIDDLLIKLQQMKDRLAEAFQKTTKNIGETSKEMKANDRKLWEENSSGFIYRTNAVTDIFRLATNHVDFSVTILNQIKETEDVDLQEKVIEETETLLSQFEDAEISILARS